MKFLGHVLIGLYILIVIVLMLPLIPLLILFELTPSRRAQRERFETKILSVLARRGEMRAPDLLKQTNEELGARFSIGTFYATMRRLEEDGLVKRRRVREPRQHGKEGQTWLVSYFRITKGGRRSRIKRASTVGETLRGFGGVLKPSGVIAIIRDVFIKG